jgi:GNAT superfamily N-acetyltransferase
MIATEFHTAKPAIPGLRFRHFAGPEDYPGMVGANMAARRAANVEEAVTVEMLAAQYAHLTNSDRDRDLLIVELDGRIVGYARVEWSDQNDGSRCFEQVCFLDPIVRRRRVGTAMLAWGEARAREIAADQPADRPLWHGADYWDADPGVAELLRRHGYSAARTFFTMIRPDLDAIPEAPAPEGFEIRPVDERQFRDIFEAGGKAFRDHWGSVQEDEASFERFVSDPRTDSSLFVVGYAGNEVAGAVLNVIDDVENGMFDRRQGLLDSVFVRRPYRRRGLGRALVLRSLAVLRDRGMTSARLGVDAENANAALHLYESCGFVRDQSSTAWRKPLDPASEDDR